MHLHNLYRAHIAAIAAVLLSVVIYSQAHARELYPGQYANAPNKEWYEKQVPTPETLKAYGIMWGSCCDNGDVCQECVVHRVSRQPPFKDEWWYEKDGVAHQLPPHIVEYVPWTPTGKPVLFLSPMYAGKVLMGDPVCLKVPGGQT